MNSQAIAMVIVLILTVSILFALIAENRLDAIDHYVRKRDNASDSAASEAGKTHYSVSSQQHEDEHWHPEERRHHKVERFFWRFTAFLTLVAAIGAIATVIISNLTLRESQVGTEQMRRQAKATEDQVDVASDTEKRQLRAYVGPVFNSFKIRCLACSPQIIWSADESIKKIDNGVIYNIKNYGSTPSRDIEVCGGLGYTDRLQSFQTMLTGIKSYCRTLTKSRVQSIWPGEEQFEVSPLVSNEVINLNFAAARKVNVYLIQFLDYKDIFDKIEHTYICRLITISMDLKYGFINCPSHSEDEHDK